MPYCGYDDSRALRAEKREHVPVAVDDADAALDWLGIARPRRAGLDGRVGVRCGEREIDVQPPAGVGDPQLRLPQLQRDRAIEADSTPVRAAVDYLESEAAVARLRAVEIQHLQDDLEDPRERRCRLGGVARCGRTVPRRGVGGVGIDAPDLDAVAVRIVDVQRVARPERELDGVEVGESASPPGVGRGRRRERVVGVYAAARRVLWSAKQQRGGVGIGGADGIGDGCSLVR